MDDLLKGVIEKIKSFVNAYRNSHEEELIEFLEGINRRIRFYENRKAENDDIDARLLRELKKFTKSLFVRTNNDSIYRIKTQKSIDRLAWTNKKHKINTTAKRYTVAQREIFYAYLGDNIGSEQNGRRPVIILQNNIGNRKGNTTIVAPVTTHQKSTLKYDEEKRMYYIEKIVNGKTKRKYLGHYEIPLRLEDGEDKLFGFINVMHLREIDRKRIDGKKVAVATEDCFNKVIAAINRNLKL